MFISFGMFGNPIAYCCQPIYMLFYLFVSIVDALG